MSGGLGMIPRPAHKGHRASVNEVAAPPPPLFGGELVFDIELEFGEARIEPALLDQLVVITGGGHTAFIEHDDAIRIQDGCEPVGDDQAGAALPQAFQRFLHQPFAFRIEGAGGFVQEKQRRVAENRTRDRDALALTTREPDPLLAEEGVETVRQLVDEAAGGRGCGCCLDLIVAGVGAAVADIVPCIGGKDHRLLGHKADFTPKSHRIDVAEVRAVEGEASGSRIIKSA